jgi:hypothetical protein
MRLIRLLVFSTQHATAQANYPDRPIKMIVPRARLNAEVLKAVGDADVRRKLEELGSQCAAVQRRSCA